MILVGRFIRLFLQSQTTVNPISASYEEIISDFGDTVHGSIGFSSEQTAV